MRAEKKKGERLRQGKRRRREIKRERKRRRKGQDHLLQESEKMIQGFLEGIILSMVEQAIKDVIGGV